MRLALFDLDHTLIPFDSTMQWLRFMIEAGEVPAGRDEDYLECCRQYLAGELDVVALHQCAMAPLADRTLHELALWQHRFAQAVVDERLPQVARDLVGRHRARGEICCVVTATSDVVAQPFALALGSAELICSRVGRVGERLTGAIEGEPCHGFGKVRLVTAWLARQGLAWADLESSCFYSDSISDLPLLSFVTEPVAVRPDEALRVHAEKEGWRVVDSLEAA